MALRNEDPVIALRPRLLALFVLVAGLYLVLLGRLYTIQILRGSELATKGESNFIRKLRIPHDRGIVYDRLGRILIDNRPSLDLYVVPAFLGDNPRTIVEHIARLVEMDEVRLQEAWQAVENTPRAARFRSLLLARDLTPIQVEAVESARSIFLLDGIEIQEGRRRFYPHGDLAAHVLGYVNEITRPELQLTRARGNAGRYQSGDTKGRRGVERRYESFLRGTDGFVEVVVDAKGRQRTDHYSEELLAHAAAVDPKPGHNVFLTLDLDLQQTAQEAFFGQAGAVVALDPQSGAILAAVSAPRFDPNFVSGALDLEDKRRLDEDPLKPWLNRFTQGQYAPGSTFKIVTALAGLQNGVIRPGNQIFCPGYFRMGRRTWRCHKDAGHGHVNLEQALQYSCDTYFYTLAKELGIEPIAAVGRSLGLGSLTGVPFDEKPGLIPDESYHDRVEKKTGGYQKGMSVNTAIGQGSVLTTPMQLAVAYAVLLNGGRVVKPQVVNRIETADYRLVRHYFNPNGETQEEVRGSAPQTVSTFETELDRQTNTDTSALELVRKGLVAVMNKPGGTGYYRRSKIVVMGGKTGTAQVIRLGRERLKANEMEYEDRDHAWFVGYAPADAPQILVAVVNEHSGHGSSQAAPIAVRVIDKFFELKASRSLAKTEQP